MKFCPKCEARLKIDSSDSEFVCPKCGYSEKGSKVTKQLKNESSSTIDVLDESEKKEALPVIKIDCEKFMKEIVKYDNSWVDYLPRTDRHNNRQALVLFNLPGKSYNEDPSLAEAMVRANGNKLSELLFDSPTEVFSDCTSLHILFDLFDTVGRSFLIKSNSLYCG